MALAGTRMRIELNKAHFPVTVLGPGRRLGLWLQGCSIRCKSCISQDTWESDPGTSIAIDDLVRWAREVTGDALDGVTISGGEPFDQPEALDALLRELARWRTSIDRDFDLLAYSGYPLRKLQAEHAGILAALDAIVPEPYVDSLPLGNLWRGSSNQPLVPLSERGRARFLRHVDEHAGENAKRLQVAVDAKRIWYIGIPDRGEMSALEAKCRERGLMFVATSWR